MALREVFARFGTEVTGLGKLKEADSAVSSLTTAAEGLVAVFAGSALVDGIKHFAEELDVLDDLSAQTGVATAELQTLGFAAELAGSSAAEMNASISLLQKSLGRTTDATGPQVDALKALGIATKDAAGGPRELNAILPEIFAGFGGLKSGAEKAEVATALFGRAGVKLIPVLSKGADGLAEVRAELDAVGGVIGEDTIKQAGEFRDNIAKMDRAFFALKGNIASAVFPQLSKIITAFAKGVGRISDWTKQTTLANTATIGLGATIGVKLFGALKPFLGPGLKFAGIFLAVDDLLGFLNGQDSLIGRAIDNIFGVGAQESARQWANDAISAAGFVFKAWADMAGTLVHEIANGFPLLSEAWNMLWTKAMITFAKAKLATIKGWNDLARALHLPALQISTAAAEESLSNLEFRLAHLGEVPVPVPTFTPGSGQAKQAAQDLLGVAPSGPPARPKSGRELARDAFGAAPGAPAQAPAGTTFGPAAAPGGGTFSPPLPAPAPASGGTVVNNFTGGPVQVQVQAPPGSDARAVAREAYGAAKQATEQSNRAAFQSLVQRSR